MMRSVDGDGFVDEGLLTVCLMKVVVVVVVVPVEQLFCCRYRFWWSLLPLLLQNRKRRPSWRTAQGPLVQTAEAAEASVAFRTAAEGRSALVATDF